LMLCSSIAWHWDTWHLAIWNLILFYFKWVVKFF
jgi:hypothetical protein